MAESNRALGCRWWIVVYAEIGKSRTPSCRSHRRVPPRSRKLTLRGSKPLSSSSLFASWYSCCSLETTVLPTSSSSQRRGRSFTAPHRRDFADRVLRRTPRERASSSARQHSSKLAASRWSRRSVISRSSYSPYQTIVRESPGYSADKALPPSIGTRLRSRSHFRSTVRTTRPRGFTSREAAAAAAEAVDPSRGFDENSGRRRDSRSSLVLRRDTRGRGVRELADAENTRQGHGSKSEFGHSSWFALANGRDADTSGHQTSGKPLKF